MGLRDILLCLVSQDAVLLIHEPRVADASLIVATVVQRIRCGEVDQITRALLHTLCQVLSVARETFLRERSHFTAAKMVLGMQVEEAEQIQVDLSAMVSGV